MEEQDHSAQQSSSDEDVDAQDNGNHESKGKGQSKADQELYLCLQGVREFSKDFEILKDLEKIFPSDDLGLQSIIKEPGRSFFFLRFKDTTAKAKFKAKGTITLRNRQLKLKDAAVSFKSLKREKAIDDLKKFSQKRAEAGKMQLAAAESEQAEPLDKDSVVRAIKDRICGYGDKPYHEQVELKKQKLADYLKEIKRIAVEKLKPEEIQTMEWLKSKREGCCELKEFVECPEEERIYYRTKSEFTIGHSCIGRLPTIGFNITDKVKKTHSVELTDTPEELMTLPVESFSVAKIAEGIIRRLTWPVFDRSTLQGFWRFVVVRISKRMKQMVINFVGNKHYFEDGEFKKNFQEGFITPLVEELNKNEELREINIRGITFQHASTSNDSIPYVEDEELDLCYGDHKTYHERIGDSVFEVSNSSFLQINIVQSERMYEYAKKCAGLDANTLLLDICSGIGTIGISVGKDCSKVVGIEMVKSSCTNALKNAQTNSMGDKYEVVEGKVEDRMEEVAGKYSAEGLKIVGIIDPPRAGLHPDVVRSLRTCKGLDCLVFICCDIKQSKQNIIDLCLPQNKKRRGPPFSPVLCAGVDMFPQTPHFESLFLLKRLYEE